MATPSGGAKTEIRIIGDELVNEIQESGASDIPVNASDLITTVAGNSSPRVLPGTYYGLVVGKPATTAAGVIAVHDDASGTTGRKIGQYTIPTSGGPFVVSIPKGVNVSNGITLAISGSSATMDITVLDGPVIS